MTTFARIAPRAALALALSLSKGSPALAQTYHDTGGTAVPAVVPVSPGGGPLFTSSNPGQIAGSISASLGGYTPSASGARMTPLAVTTSDSSGTLPTGTVAVVSNVGSNPMYCNVNGVAATTSDELVAASGWFAFTIPNGVTALHCIATGGSTTANAVGGAGLPTGGGGGGSVPTGSAGSPNASVVSVQGVTGGYALPVSGTFWQSTQPVSLASLPALASGANTIGAVTQANGPWTINQTQLAGTALGAPSNYGTSPGAVEVQGVNAYVTNTPGVSESGTWTVQPGNIANTTPWLVTGTGGTFPATESGAWNITNISGTISLPTGAATSANQPTAASQGSTTSGQTGNLQMGAVTTSAPSYTTGQTDPLSLDTSGNLRVNCTTGCSPSGGSSLADEGTFTQGTTSFTVAGGFYNSSVNNLTSGQAGAVQMTNTRHMKMDWEDLAGTALGAPSSWGSAPSGAVQGVNADVLALPPLPAGSNTIGSIANTSFGISGALPAFAATPTVAPQDASNLCPSGCSLSATGVFFTADTTGYQSVSVELTANAGGNTIVFEASDDNSTWVGANGLPAAATGASGATGTLSTTSASLYRVPVNGRYFRVRLSAYVSGTTTVYAYLHATPTNVVTAAPTLAGGTNTIGKVDVLGSAGATMDVAIGGATAATDALQAGGVYNSSAPSLSSGQGAALQLTSAGSLHATVDNSVTLASNQAVSSAGWTPSLANGLTTTPKTVDASAGVLGFVQCYNPNSSQIYVQVFNAASPTLGTTTPVLSIPIGPTSTGGLAMSSYGVALGGSAIVIAATTTVNGSTAPSTAPDCNVGYH